MSCENKVKSATLRWHLSRSSTMEAKTPIRIIKRDERQGGRRSETEKSQPNGTGKRHNGREIAENVKVWVREFQERRAADPRHAFEQLFGEPSSPLTSLT